METNTDFNVISLNVRGLRSLNKRRGIFLWLTKQKADIVFLQETYSTFQDENFWKTQWKGRMLFSHGSNHSKGASILVRQGLDFEQKTIECDPNGRFIFLEALFCLSIFMHRIKFTNRKPSLKGSKQSWKVSILFLIGKSLLAVI